MKPQRLTESEIMRKYSNVVAESQQLNEGMIDSIKAMASKIKALPGIGQYIKQAQSLKQQTVDIVKSSQSGKEVVDKLQALAQQNQPQNEGINDMARYRKSMQTDIAANRAGSVVAVGASAAIGFMAQAVGFFDIIIAQLHQGGTWSQAATAGLYPIIGMLAGLVLAVHLWNKANKDKRYMDQHYSKQPAQQPVDEGFSNYDGTELNFYHVVVDFLIEANTPEEAKKKVTEYNFAKVQERGNGWHNFDVIKVKQTRDVV